MRRLARKQINFGVVSEIFMVESWRQFMELPSEGASLVEERDWGLPWPEFDENLKDCDEECNLRIFELERLTLPENKEMKKEYERLLIEENSKKMVRKLYSKRMRYIRNAVRILFKHNTEEMSRSGYNIYTRLLTVMISQYGLRKTCLIEVNIAIYILANTFAFISRLL